MPPSSLSRAFFNLPGSPSALVFCLFTHSILFELLSRPHSISHLFSDASLLLYQNKRSFTPAEVLNLFDRPFKSVHRRSLVLASSFFSYPLIIFSIPLQFSRWVHPGRVCPSVGWMDGPSDGWSVGWMVRRMVSNLFLDGPTHFYMRVCPSVGRSVSPSITCFFC